MMPTTRDSQAAPARSYIGATTDTSNLTNYSFAGVSIGAAAASRLVVVAVHWGTVSSAVISSATIAGVAATIIAQTLDAASGAGVGLISAPVPTGTTGTIAVNMSAGCADMAIAVHRITGLLSMTKRKSGSITAGAADSPLELFIPGNGVAIVANENTSATTAPTGYTEDYDAQIGAEAAYYEGGHYDEPNGESIMRNMSSSVMKAMVAASWR